MIALCQDCLRAAEVDAAMYNAGEALCVCGGDVCACGSCMECLRALQRGCRDPELMHLENLKPGFEWSPEGGASE